jgi:hypothetical protein
LQKRRVGSVRLRSAVAEFQRSTVFAGNPYRPAGESSSSSEIMRAS